MRWGWMNWTPPLRRVTAVLFFGFVNWLLLAPGTTFEDVHVFCSQQDKLAHLGIFGALTGLALWALPANWSQPGRICIFLAVMLAYGAGIEIVQPLIPGSGRSTEGMDLATDAIGIAAGAGLFRVLLAAPQTTPAKGAEEPCV